MKHALKTLTFVGVFKLHLKMITTNPPVVEKLTSVSSFLLDF